MRVAEKVVGDQPDDRRPEPQADEAAEQHGQLAQRGWGNGDEARHCRRHCRSLSLLGTLAIFLYPVLYHLNQQHHLIRMSPSAYGIFAGSTIHEVAQVVAAGNAISVDAGNTAVIAKMVRVMMLAPFLILLSAYLSRHPGESEAPDGSATHTAMQKGDPQPGGIVIPWFALGFVAVAGLNSLALLPRPIVGAVIDIDTVVLAMAMAALGLTTQVSAIRNAGGKPLALAALLFAWLIGGGIAINAGVGALLA